MPVLPGDGARVVRPPEGLSPEQTELWTRRYRALELGDYRDFTPEDLADYLREARAALRRLDTLFATADLTREQRAQLEQLRSKLRQRIPQENQ